MPQDIENMIKKRYAERYSVHGYSGESLGWNKDKQDMRFHAITSSLEIKGSSVLDIGCGFGDILKYFGNLYHDLGISSYYGVDLTGEFIQKAQEIYKNDPRILFEEGNFLNISIERKYDYVISAGMFNHDNYGMNMYAFIEEVMKKAFNLCNNAIVMDFLSHYVNYKNKDNFYSKPEKILEIAYKLSRNIILKNDYFPFEFCVIVFKDDTYDSQNTYFKTFQKNMKIYSQTQNCSE